MQAAPRAALDNYGLLKTMIDQWRDVFDDAFGRNDKHRARNFVSTALEARNATYHLSLALQDDEALRYLDAMHQLLRVTKSAEAEIAEVKRLYDEQRRDGLGAPAGAPTPAASTWPSPRRRRSRRPTARARRCGRGSKRRCRTPTCWPIGSRRPSSPPI